MCCPFWYVVTYIASACNFKCLVPQCLTSMCSRSYARWPQSLRLSCRASGKALLARRLKRGSTCCESTTRTQKKKLLIWADLSRKPNRAPNLQTHTVGIVRVPKLLVVRIPSSPSASRMGLPRSAIPRRWAPFAKFDSRPASKWADIFCPCTKVTTQELESHKGDS